MVDLFGSQDTPPRTTKLDAEFAAVIESRSVPEPNTGCWLWLGAVDRKGYGRVSRHNFHLAHRLSFFLATGDLDQTRMVLHRCDQPGCVNPDHLFQGTAKENTADMVRKGRARGHKGEDSGSVLTEDLVRHLRAIYIPGHPEFGASALAVKLGYQKGSNSTVWSAISGKTWGHVQ